MEDIHKVAIYPLTERTIDRYEEIDTAARKLTNDTEKQCRHLHKGSITWSLVYKKVWMELEYWVNRRSYLNKEYHNVGQLLVLQNKLQLNHNPNLLKVDLINKIKLVHKARQNANLWQKASASSTAPSWLCQKRR